VGHLYALLARAPKGGRQSNFRVAQPALSIRLAEIAVDFIEWLFVAPSRLKKILQMQLGFAGKELVESGSVWK
jgi:hypothetical protein